MPELPEVETIRQQLEKYIQGATIKSVKIYFEGRIEPKNFIELVQGKKIIAVDRRAKILMIRLDGDYTLLIHLKLTGRMLIKKKGAAVTKHTHAVFELSGKYDLHWEDIRKFGWLKLMKNEMVENQLAKEKYGPEPLDNAFTLAAFEQCLSHHAKSKIKPLLMKQSCVAGLGNIYVAESLWLAKTNPLTVVAKIKKEKIADLHQAIKSILTAAVKNRGSSADDYVDAFGEKGEFYPKLKVYGRTGLPCLNCQTILKTQRIGGRSTVFCPKCQKE